MKKILIFSVITCMMIALMGCGESSEYDLSKSTLNAGKKIVECTDQYINSEITLDEYEKLFVEYKSKIVRNTSDDGMVSAMAGDLYANVSMSKDYMQNYLGATSIEDIIESRDKLAEYVGMKPYEQ